jgi:hypothetical protein
MGYRALATALVLITTAAGGEPALCQEESEEVTLKNGLTYRVPTKEGMPVPFKSEQVDVNSIGITANTSTKALEFVLMADLKASGSYHVTVTTPVNNRLSTRFDVQGPGEIFQTFFGNREHPLVWNWVEEPGETWLPLVFTFEGGRPPGSFTVTQWQKFNPGAKTTLAKTLKELE